MRKLAHRFDMLVDFFHAVAAKEPALLGVGCMETDGVVFVVAHHGECLIGLAHVAHQMQGLAYLRTPIDKIANKTTLRSCGWR